MASVYKIKLQKGDTVIVRSGKHKNKTGKILFTHPTTNKVTVEGVNIVKKHVKPNRKYPQGGIIDLTRPIAVSKVGIYDLTTKRASRISMKVSKDGVKTRIYTQSKKDIK